MDEQTVLAQLQQMIRRGTPAAQAAMQIARLYPQHAQAIQRAVGGNPAPAQGQAVAQQPRALGTGPSSPSYVPPQGAAPAGRQPQLPPSGPVGLPQAPAGKGGYMGSGLQEDQFYGDSHDGVRPQAPGYYRAGAPASQDKYGGAMRGNTNAAGVQSNGDDDPWLIGAARGTTYDPETMLRWHQRAQAGDGKAAYVLRQVGFYDEQNRPVFNSADGLEQWANSRGLDRRAAQGSATPWYHDPKNWGANQGFTGAEDADAAFKATPWAQMATPNDHPSSYPGARAASGTLQQPPAGGNTPGIAPPAGAPTAPPANPSVEARKDPAQPAKKIYQTPEQASGATRFDGPESGFNPADWEIDPEDPNHARRKQRPDEPSGPTWY